MTETLLLETTVPRTLDAWLARFEDGSWRGTRVEGWLFEDAAARRAAERRLAAAGVQAFFRSAYKPLLHFFLEEVEAAGLVSATVRYPVHAQASAQRFLLEAYPLAGLWPQCRFEFVAGGEGLDYEVNLRWHDGREQQACVFAPNRVHVGTTGSPLLSPTGWLRTQHGDAAESTDYEQVFARIVECVEGHAWPQAEPFFERLDIRVELPGIAQRLPVGHETVSTHEALHEDIYFSLLEIFQRRSGRAPGDRRLQPGQIVPDVRAAAGPLGLRIALRAFLPLPLGEGRGEGTSDDVPLAQLAQAPTATRITREMQQLGGQPFTALTRQGRPVLGLYQPGPTAPVLVSGGQHANETSGIVGALRAAETLRARGEHFALIGLENPDGYALRSELAAWHPEHMLHAARYTALGDDLEYREQAPWFEREARRQALALSDAQLHVNLHGYPAHEWTRPLSGYLPQGFELWTVPKGFFLVLRHHRDWQAEARALLARVAQALSAVPGLADYNARQLALYEQHAGGLPFELLHGMACTVTEVERADSAPVTLITEFPDETVHGEAFRFAHTVQMETVLAAVAAWQELARRS
ncbi:peptidase M14 [Ramlibacter sp. G-1-2-2]|uniref:Peptidase M14 n=1 Tax=Ramlibacter agri TaxID=2728837 RepID=A0A848HG24_9BURK|nr:peptidase M14 [Ramlibacter agri]NML46588.1 peptidase M14 [Ramlibacter agri]